MMFDLYLFDFDGTIIDSEPYHHIAYNIAFKKLDPTFDMNFEQYCDYKHNNNNSYIKHYFSDEQIKIASIDKEQIFFKLAESNDIKLINGFEQFANQILSNGKEICVVTHSSVDRVQKFINKYDILKKISYWITKESYTHKKPHPECYIHAINKFAHIPCDKMIAFEDSLNGYCAIRDLNIHKVFIGKKTYPFYHLIDCANIFDDYVHFMNNHNPSKLASNKIENKIDIYIDQLHHIKDHYTKNVNLVCDLIMKCTGTIYILGVGKNHHIATKCSSTWNSYGIKSNTMYVQNLMHGDMGLFGKNDYIIYVSNSGQTIELINTAEYIKKNFSFYQISVCNSENSLIKKHVNIEFVISDTKFKEADDINVAPTVSSVCFMIFFDLVGIMYAEKMKYTKQHFILHHPGGVIGNVKIIDVVFIFAAGNGVRLLPYTKNIPKILVNIDNENMLTKIINYWKHYTNNFVIVANDKYNTLIDYYASLTDINYKIKNISIDNQGTAYTIKHTMTSDYTGKKIICTWCDIFPTDTIDTNIFKKTNIIFTSGNECRYYAEKNIINKQKNGNIIGIYYFSNYEKLICDDDNLDICDCYLENYEKFDVHEINVLDCGDMEKYNKLLNLQPKYKTRHFNKIDEYGNDKLIKYSINKQGNKLIQNEIKWYKINNFKMFPQIYHYGENSFVMKKMTNHEPLYKIFDNISNNEQILDKIICSLNELHSTKHEISCEQLYDDVNYEFKLKITERVNDIKQLLNAFTITHVNDIKITHSLDEIINILIDIILNNVTGRNWYAFIHGDCQFSNILYNSVDSQIKFIDPRGYFGKTLFFGIPEYDISKVAYALSGYDKFNNDASYLNIVDNKIYVNVNCNHFHIKYISELTKISLQFLYSMVIIHWIGLAQYNKTNIAKCINSYYYGIYLFYHCRPLISF